MVLNTCLGWRKCFNNKVQNLRFVHFLAFLKKSIIKCSTSSLSWFLSMLKRGVGLFENKSPFAAYHSAQGSAYHTVTISLSLRKMCWASFERSSISCNSQEGTSFPSKSFKKEMFPHNVTMFNNFTFLASFNAEKIGGGLFLLKKSPLAGQL